jgi:tetratricopeptide (TPR) repeat protein
MKKRTRLLPLLLLPLLGAAWSATPDDLVRQGNAALARKDYAAALRLFDQASDRTTDPGLVAFNRGVALYQQGDFAQAESYFRLCLPDAHGPRKSAALYNLADCLVQQAGERDSRRLQEAIDLYRQCLRQEDVDEPLAAQAAHNLELAGLLWVRASAPREEQPHTGSSNEDPSPPPPTGSEDPLSNESQLGAQASRTGDPRRLPGDQGPKPTPTNQQSPGKGDLPVVPDRDELMPMSPEEAAQHLQQALERVLQEQRAHRQHTLRPPSQNAPDW